MNSKFPIHYDSLDRKIVPPPYANPSSSFYSIEHVQFRLGLILHIADLNFGCSVSASVARSRDFPSDTALSKRRTMRKLVLDVKQILFHTLMAIFPGPTHIFGKIVWFLVMTLCQQAFLAFRQ